MVKTGFNGNWEVGLGGKRERNECEWRGRGLEAGERLKNVH